MKVIDRRIEQRIAKSFLAAVLLADLKPVDLRKFANEISHNQDLLSHLARVLESVVLDLDRMSLERKDIRPIMGDEERAYEIIQRRRLSKRDILLLMDKLMPNAIDHQVSEKRSLRVILSQFRLNASPTLWSRFLSAVENGRQEGDAYLSGILQKR